MSKHLALPATIRPSALTESDLSSIGVADGPPAPTPDASREAGIYWAVRGGARGRHDLGGGQVALLTVLWGWRIIGPLREASWALQLEGALGLG